jgi:hypothetical protein
MVTIGEIEQTFKDIFQDEDGKVSSVETVYELSKNKDFYKLVISIHGISIEDTLIIHTKFIFKTDLDKKNIIEDSFIYLYDINCVYNKVEFKNSIDLKTKIDDIINSNDFGQDIQILSDFIEAPGMFLNYYMRRSKITDYSIFDVEYEPKFKTVPCEDITFDFKINVNDNYEIDLSISKKERDEDKDYDTYVFQFKFLDEYSTVENDTLKNIHFTIGSNIAKILDEKLK